MRKEYLKGEDIETIYFGGGTPSQLEKEDFEQIFDTIREHYGLNHCQEITLEANPDDLSQEYLEMLSSLPFNRLSMGIQTFDDATLKLLRRRHNARTAIEAIDRCRKADFQNISIDLIYGLPGETKERWENDLRQAISLNVEHISAYHLIYEEDTPIYNITITAATTHIDITFLLLNIPFSILLHLPCNMNLYGNYLQNVIFYTFHFTIYYNLKLSGSK